MELTTKDKVSGAFQRWIQRLGLAWWEIDIYWCESTAEIIENFRQVDGGVVAARVDADWKYAEAAIYVNLPAFESMDDAKIESVVVHELCHILVNEMREGELHHEERVVTGLTKAVFWVASAAREETKG